MDFNINKFISNFIVNQFPQFYKEDGENFILFMKSYYEWMEQSGNPIYESRTLLDYRDIDNTIEEFLEFFQKKYLYGIPFNVISNKRFLLKHILDVYRSKGTIQCYKLLFKLLYNEDVEIYLPGIDVLRVSDGKWKEPKYLELTDSELTETLIGKRIIGTSSKVSATVETFIKENYNKSIVNIIYLSNITPRNGRFVVGEKILEEQYISNTEIITNSPTVIGSLDKISIIDGSQGFKVGDIIKIAQRDVSNNNVISYGKDGLLRVTETSSLTGSLRFVIEDSGFGYTSNALVFLYKNSANGESAGFTIQTISSVKTLTYNTDIICNYSNLSLDSSTFNFPGDNSANLSSTLECFSYETDTFGSILNLGNITTGNNYDTFANVFVRSTQLSKPLQGSISYDTSSNTVSGTSTEFESVFANDDVIALRANSSLSSSLEFAVIKEVSSNTSLVLYGPPSLNSTASAEYMASPTVLPSQYAFYEEEMFSIDGSINGENEVITAFPNIGNDSIADTYAIDSGKGYVEGEIIKAYLYGSISNNLVILSGGTNYSNNEEIIFSGGRPGIVANGYITTDSNGSITSATIVNAGSGYENVPNVRVITANGSGGVLQAEFQEFNTVSEVIGRVEKGGLGRAKGFWQTTDGFLNSDKYIQDSFYYQDYSYEIKVARTLNKYKDIIYNTFHNTGTELFGKYLKYLIGESNSSIIEESVRIEETYTVDDTYLTSDSTIVTSDSRNPFVYLLTSETNITSDSVVTVDKYYI